MAETHEVAAQDDSGGRVDVGADMDLAGLRWAAEAARDGGDWDRAVAKMGRLTRNGRAAAAGNPETILALLDRLEVAETQAGRAERFLAAADERSRRAPDERVRDIWRTVTDGLTEVMHPGTTWMADDEADQ